jgi:glycosyltransferase involved in cell wall biosynthesis
LHDYPVKTKCRTKLISWYADLQHEYYPEFFNRRKILERTLRIKFILRNTDDLVVSSQAVANDFVRFFRLRKEMRMHIFHFVSIIDDFSKLDFNELRKKYNLPEKYYMISNQFHKHKNHKVLLKALILLKGKGSKIHMAMTGRFPDASYSPHMQELHSIINDHNLQSQISLMGIIPRNEQLLLMKHSQAVLQPSLFEGWSTVIEDAISLQVPVIASSLPVNIEQLGPDGNYFEPHDAEKLAEILNKFPVRNLNDIMYENYTERVRKAAKVFINIFRN